LIPAHDADPRLSPFTGADICAQAGFAVQPGQRTPRFDDDTWDFTPVTNLPVQVERRDRYWNFTMITDPRWRLVAKELMFALLVPRHEAVAILPHAYRTPMALRTCIRRLLLLTRWLNWLTSHGVTGLGEVTEEHCDGFLAHCGHAHDKQGRQLREASPSHRRQAVAVVLDLISYRELFTSDRHHADLRPWKGASSSAVVGMRPDTENKTQPVPDDVLQPLLAAGLLIVNTLAPHLVELRGQLRTHQIRKTSDPRRSRQPTLHEMAAAVEQHTATGEPLIQIPDYQVRNRLANGWNPHDPLLIVNFSALAQRIGCADYRQAWTDEGLRQVVLKGVDAVGVAKQWHRQATPVAHAGTGEQVPWTVPLHTREVIDLVEVARAACMTITAAASGMRSSELMELLVGCRRPPQQTAPDRQRFRIASKIIKGQPIGGTDDEWVVIEDVHRAVGLAEQLLDDPEPGSPLFGRTCFVSRYQGSLRPWVNGPAGQRLGLAPIPAGHLNLRMLRRSLAVEMAYRPHGVLATKIAMKHVTVATTEGYAARPGGAQAKLLAEVNQHEQERNLRLLLEEFRNYQQGTMPSGPGARWLTEFFATIDGELTQAPSSPARTMGGDQEARSLLTRRAQTLHLGVANYCWFTDPAQALCLKLAGTPDADEPLTGLCDSTRCPQATHHHRHRTVWADTVTKNKAFLSGLTRGQKLERIRLQAEVTRAELVLTGIDASTQTTTPSAAEDS
jgi:hypothetical protein